MSSKYSHIDIKPIKTGFLVEIVDHYYDGDKYAFASWNEVIAFITDKQPVFKAEDESETTASKDLVAVNV